MPGLVPGINVLRTRRGGAASFSPILKTLLFAALFLSEFPNCGTPALTFPIAGPAASVIVSEIISLIL